MGTTLNAQLRLKFTAKLTELEKSKQTIEGLNSRFAKLERMQALRSKAAVRRFAKGQNMTKA